MSDYDGYRDFANRCAEEHLPGDRTEINKERSFIENHIVIPEAKRDLSYNYERGKYTKGLQFEREKDQTDVRLGRRHTSRRRF